MPDPIQLQRQQPISLQKTAQLDAPKGKLPEVAQEFERIFALQMVSELTKGAFKTADNAIGQAGSEMYRSQINETLASSLASQGSLGIARMLNEHWKTRGEETP